MTRRAYNATNQPRTCVWCGRRLYSQSSTRSLNKDLADINRVYQDKEQRSLAIVQRIEYHELHKFLYGKHHNFCTSSCAISFAEMAAIRGYRFVPAAEAAAAEREALGSGQEEGPDDQSKTIHRVV